MSTSPAAGNPEVFNRQKVGVLFNTAFDGYRLSSEAWIDVNRVGLVDPRVRDALRDGRVLEVSTGLGTELEDEAVAIGTVRAWPASRLYPDHLAILPEGRGACSVAAGCGMARIA